MPDLTYFHGLALKAVAAGRATFTDITDAVFSVDGTPLDGDDRGRFDDLWMDDLIDAGDGDTTEKALVLTDQGRRWLAEHDREESL